MKEEHNQNKREAVQRHPRLEENIYWCWVNINQCPTVYHTEKSKQVFRWTPHIPAKTPLKCFLELNLGWWLCTYCALEKNLSNLCVFVSKPMFLHICFAPLDGAVHYKSVIIYSKYWSDSTASLEGRKFLSWVLKSSFWTPQRNMQRRQLEQDQVGGYVLDIWG